MPNGKNTITSLLLTTKCVIFVVSMVSLQICLTAGHARKNGHFTFWNLKRKTTQSQKSSSFQKYSFCCFGLRIRHHHQNQRSRLGPLTIAGRPLYESGRILEKKLNQPYKNPDKTGQNPRKVGYFIRTEITIFFQAGYFSRQKPGWEC